MSKILITGASSGIGAALAKLYATPQNHLILLARRKERLLELREELLLHAKKVDIITVDVTQTVLLQEAIALLGDVDMVILNAGVSLGHGKAQTTTAQMRWLYEINLFANHAILEILLPSFEKNGGKIVFISSLASFFTMPTSIAYSSSKRALNAYAQGIRVHLMQSDTQVVVIHPGFIVSEMTDKNRFHMPFLLSTKEGATRIKNAIEKSRKNYAFPKRFFYLVRILSILPYFVQKLILFRFGFIK